MRIAVDIDGILTVETEGYDFINRTPNVENISEVNRLYAAGHCIHLYTARYDIEEDRKITEAWLILHKVQYHFLTLGKLQYDVLIDDKAINSFKQLKI